MNQDLSDLLLSECAAGTGMEVMYDERPAREEHETDRSLWSDACLVAAVRDDTPDLEALNVLAARFQKYLWSRCLRLTGNRDKASDLAQETWCRLLRRRTALKPDQNFRAYLITVATNIWRDEYRAARRAGPMAEYRLVPLDGAGRSDAMPTLRTTINANGGGDAFNLAEAVPDTREVECHARRLWAEELDHVLACLSPLQCEVLRARFLQRESCAMIGLRFGRTEQTISAWVRDALCQAREYLRAGVRTP